MQKNNIVFKNLKTTMANKEITITDLANELGMNRETMSRKLSGISPLYTNESFAIGKRLGDDVNYLFAELKE